MEGMRLWKVKGTDIYLVKEQEKNNAFFRAIGEVKKEYEYIEIPNEGLKALFEHFFQDLDFLHLRFDFSHSDEDEVEEKEELNQLLRIPKPNRQAVKDKAMELFDVLQEDVFGGFHHFQCLEKTSEDLNNYYLQFNSILYPVGATSDIDEKFAFKLYQQILMWVCGDKEYEFEPITLMELPKELNPLHNSYRALKYLFDYYGDKVPEALNIQEKEWKKIQKHFLDKAKRLEEDIVYSR